MIVIYQCLKYADLLAKLPNKNIMIIRARCEQISRRIPPDCIYFICVTDKNLQWCCCCFSGFVINAQVRKRTDSNCTISGA